MSIFPLSTDAATLGLIDLLARQGATLFGVRCHVFGEHQLRAMKIFAAAATFLALAGPALAADLPSTKGPPPFVPPPPALTWTGCYAGVNIGYGWQRNHSYDPNVSCDAGADTGNGVVGGGQLGCDYQLGAFVFGVQGRFDGAGVSGNHLYLRRHAGRHIRSDHAVVRNANGTYRLHHLPQALALCERRHSRGAHRHYTDVDMTIPYWGSASPTRVGWTIGAGAEYALTPNWSIFAEYDYTGFRHPQPSH